MSGPSEVAAQTVYGVYARVFVTMAVAAVTILYRSTGCVYKYNIITIQGVRRPKDNKAMYGPRACRTIHVHNVRIITSRRCFYS